MWTVRGNLRRKRIRAIKKVLQLYDESSGVTTALWDDGEVFDVGEGKRLATWIDTQVMREAMLDPDEPGYPELPDLEGSVFDEVDNACETIADVVIRLMNVFYEL